MEWKATKLYSILTLTCPYCHEGEFFVSSPYDLKHVGDLHSNCPKCGGKYTIEPGFYFGAMFVAYGLGVAVCCATYLILAIAIPALPIPWQIGIIASVMLIGGPWFYALSKIIWANLFFRYKGL
jgi:uncharacterized protein (DUF983 family)